MPPEPIVDLSKIDFGRVLVDKAGIRQINPQRFEMEHLDGIVYLDTEKGEIVGYKEVREDEFWTRGHIPGRPLLPGVLMIEAAAQLVSYCTHMMLQTDKFIGFGGVDEVKFRGTVVPPCRLVIAGRAIEVRPRRSVCYVQGFVDRTMVFEGKITGMPV
jgi:3-hydroxyacyl-[acyl-carrier-protein] dehydratase